MQHLVLAQLKIPQLTKSFKMWWNTFLFIMFLCLTIIYLLGFGKVVSLHLNDKPNISGVRFFNFPEPIQQSIIHVPVTSLKDIYSSSPQQDQADAIQGISFPELKHLFFERRFDRHVLSLSLSLFLSTFILFCLLSFLFSLIVVIKSDPSSISKALMPFLKYGQPFVFFSPYLQVTSQLNYLQSAYLLISLRSALVCCV